MDDVTWYWYLYGTMNSTVCLSNSRKALLRLLLNPGIFLPLAEDRKNNHYTNFFEIKS